MTKTIAAALPVALLVLASTGCSQNSTAPALSRPDNAASSSSNNSAQSSADTNTFGDSKEAAAGSAAAARDANYGAGSQASQTASGSSKDNPDPKH